MFIPLQENKLRGFVRKVLHDFVAVYKIARIAKD